MIASFRKALLFIVSAGLILLLAAAEPVTGQTTSPSRASATPAPAQSGPSRADSIPAVVDTGNGRLRVRWGPGIQYPIMTWLQNGASTDVLARNPDGGWMLIIGPDNLYGWVAAPYLRLDGDPADVPVIGRNRGGTIPQGTPAAGTSPAATAAAAEEGGPATPAPDTPRAGAADGLIAVPVFNDETQTYDVWSVDADGSNLQKIAAEASAPALSRDGRQLAYRSWKPDERGIVIAGRDGSNPLRVTDNLEDVLPSFSPDGTKVAFSSYRWGDRKSRLYYAWTDEENRRAWEWGDGGIFGEDPDWMRDNRILYRLTRRDIAQDELWSMRGTDGLDRQRLFVADSIGALAVAPDSRHVAFMARDEVGWNLYALDLESGREQRLTSSAASDGLPAWSPDGRTLAFVSDRSGRWALWMMDADGSNQRRIVNLPGPVDGRVEFEPDYLNHGWLEEQIAWSR